MADSPFLAPGVQFAWDSTSLGWFKECPRKYYYSMIEGYRSRGESVHLKFGILYHNALELYDKCRAGVVERNHNFTKDGIEYDVPVCEVMDHDEACNYVVRDLLIETWDRETNSPWASDHNLKNRDNLVRSVVWYLEQFGDDNDPATTVILQNGRPAVELSFRFEVDDGLMLSGHLDRVVEFMGGHYVMDRKTSTTTISSYYFDQYQPDNQMSLYSYAAQVIYQTPVRGVIIDAAQIAVGFTRFERGMTYRTPAQLEEWLNDTRAYVWQAQAMGERMQSRVAQGKDAVGAWPMNDKSCHKYGGCVFRDICSKDPHVRQIFLDSDYVREPWNPLIPR